MFKEGFVLKGDHHGCPYKSWSAQQLSAQLSKMQLSSSQVSETVAKAKAGHYQIACALAFEGTQPLQLRHRH